MLSRLASVSRYRRVAVYERNMRSKPNNLNVSGLIGVYWL